MIHGIHLIVFSPKKLQDRWCGHLEIVCQLSAGFDLAIKKKRKIYSFPQKKEREERKRTVVFDNKETFCLPFAAPVKSATKMEIHYETLLKKCDQSLCSQLGTGDRLWCLSVWVWRILINEDLTMRSRDLVSFLLFCFFIHYFFHGGGGYIDRGMTWMGGGNQAPLICSLSLSFHLQKH